MIKSREKRNKREHKPFIRPST